MTRYGTLTTADRSSFMPISRHCPMPAHPRGDGASSHGLDHIAWTA